MKQVIPADDEHIRPEKVSDETVAATGKLSEALETIERARGRLYDFHQLIGHADIQIAEAVEMLEKAGHQKLAKYVKEEIVGRNVIAGRWTFQIVEDFDDNYYAAVKHAEKKIRDHLLAGKRHVYESEMKEKNRTKGHAGHEARP